jgi:hypothetical protein
MHQDAHDDLRLFDADDDLETAAAGAQPAGEVTVISGPETAT